MVWRRGWTTAASVATKIGADYREMAGEQRRDAAPHQVSLREPVQEQDGWAGPRPAREDAGLARVDLGGLKIVQHPDGALLV
jgi:hypothetical protein